MNVLTSTKLWILALGLVISVLSACADDAADGDLCADVDCELGVCDPDSGACTNPTACSESDRCLDGFSCNAGLCEADIPCPEGVCANGVCVAGACVNPAVCQTNSNCLEGSYCSPSGTCESDPCAGVECERGVCEVGTGQCVNDICTSATESIACLEGHKCNDGTCVDEADFCMELDCQNGVCDFEAQECVNAVDCAGLDANCLSGFFCNDGNACQANRCGEGLECLFGVCEPATGNCVNATTCDESSDCIVGNVCVDGGCVEAEEACGEPGCTGNQECVYDEGSQSAACEENTLGCFNGLDCLDDRVCEMGACVAPTACVADGYEPNDDAQSAKDMIDVGGAEPVAGNICGVDTDVWTFNTTDDPDEIGLMVVELKIDSADVGLGVLEVELINPLGNTVQSGKTDLAGVPSQQVRLEHFVEMTDQGKYQIVVTGEGVSTAGVRYSLSADVLDADIAAACSDARVLLEGQSAVNIIGEGTSMGLRSSCHDHNGSRKEDIYAIEIAELSQITVTVTPLDAEDDLVVSLRSVCAKDETEVRHSCTNDTQEGGLERLTTGLDPGTYFIVVEGFDEDTYGGYTISYNREAKTCTRADNSCIDADNANMCNRFQTAIEPVACDLGCEMGTGSCFEEPGDSCNAMLVADENTPWTGQLPIGKLTSNMSAPDCGFTADGPESIWNVSIPANHVLEVGVERADYDNAVVYLLSDCADTTSCVGGTRMATGTNGDIRRFNWHNDTGADVNYALVVDVETSTTYGAPLVDIAIRPRICTPGEALCVLNRESQTCNDAGTRYSTSVLCDNGCDSGTGRCTIAANDVCGGAEVLTSGVEVTGNLALNTNAYSATDCGVYNFGRSNDAVYALDLVENQFVTLEVDSQEFDVGVWASTECDAADELGSCDYIAERVYGVGKETLEFLVPADGRYYFTVDSREGVTSGIFTIEATVQDPACIPNTALGCDLAGNNVEYCNEVAQIETYACAGGCNANTGQCLGAGTAGACFDAEVISSTSGSIFGTLNEGTNFIQEPSGIYGDCLTKFEYPGAETYYRFDLAPGEVLDLNYVEGSLYGQEGVMLVLTDECMSMDSCKSAANSYQHFATTPQTVFVVIDANYENSVNAFTLNYEITATNYVCLPSSRSCVTDTLAEVCASDGYSSIVETCPGGCIQGSCRATAEADACATAPVLNGSATLLMDPTVHTNTFALSSAQTCWDGTYNTNGEDLVYQVDLQPNEVLQVTGIAKSDYAYPVVYLLDDCSQPAATCQTGARGGFESDAYLRYQAGPAGETLFLVLDHEYSIVDPRQFDVEIGPPACTNGAALGCNIDQTALQYCVQGVIEEYVCNGGCTNGTCAIPKGDICADPMKLDRTAGSGSVEFDSSNFEPFGQTGLGASGGCVFGNGRVGAEAFYEIDLLAGETFTAEVVQNNSYAPMLWVSDDPCAGTCLAADLGVGPKKVAYTADSDRTVTLVFDLQSNYSSGVFDFDWTIESAPTCAADQTYCVDATTVATCSSDGQELRTYPCLDGCDAESGACRVTVANHDQCGGGSTISEGGVFALNMDEPLTDLFSMSASSCVGLATLGVDAHFTVALQPNQILRASVRFLDDINAGVYIYTDCLDAEGSCIDGAYAKGARASATHQAGGVEEQVYVGVDLNYSYQSGPVMLEIEILDPDCDPATFAQTCNDDNTGFTYCNESGFTREYVCKGNGVCGADNRCEEPVGDVCLDPIDATPASVGVAKTITGTLANHTSVYDLNTGNACTGSATRGPDPVHAVDLLAGQVLTASLVSTETTPEDLALYVVSGCSDVEAQCLAGADLVGADATPESVTFTAASDTTIYLVVDSFYAGASGGYQLDVTVN